MVACSGRPGQFCVVQPMVGKMRVEIALAGRPTNTKHAEKNTKRRMKTQAMVVVAGRQQRSRQPPIITALHRWARIDALRTTYHLSESARCRYSQTVLRIDI